MENLMALRSVRTLALAAALGAACGGGGPPGGGNGNGDTDGGDETDGTTGNGDRTDGHVPDPNNPLIQAIPGMWRMTLSNGQPPPEEWTTEGLVRVDAEDPDCTDALQDAPDDYSSVGPPGDACIYWYVVVNWWILEGARVRHEDPISQLTGDVLDNGRRIVTTYTRMGYPSVIEEYEKIE